MTTSLADDEEVTAEHPAPIQFKFIEREDGLVEIEAINLPSLIAAFRDVDEEMDCGLWAKSAIAAKLATKYKRDGGVEALAETFALSPSYIRQIARTHRTFSESFTIVKDLSFSHHKVACLYANPTEALLVAKENGYNHLALQDWISRQHARKASKATRKARAAATSQFLDHLEHAEEVVEQLIKVCPNGDFADRVYRKEWLEQLRWEARQLNRKLNMEIVLAAIEGEGAQDIDQIKKVTDLPKSDIEGVVGQLVAENQYEWVDKGGETDRARGTNSKMLHKVGTPLGSSASLPRTVSRYAN